MLDVFNSVDAKTFRKVMIRATIISLMVFLLFAWAGDRVFSDLIHARFSSFLIFGGLIFLIIGIRFVFKGPEAITNWKGDPEHLAGSIAMPFMIGPGTVMASVFAGTKLDMPMATLSIVTSVTAASICIVLLKIVYDKVKARNEKLLQRYVMITGRIMALVIGTFSIEMIFQGIELWLKGLKAAGLN